MLPGGRGFPQGGPGNRPDREGAGRGGSLYLSFLLGKVR